jgi:hypothetical protein
VRPLPSASWDSVKMTRVVAAVPNRRCT